MSENQEATLNKKLLENSFVGSLVVPIAIVLVGALIIFGVTKMLSSGKDYKDLVYDLQSKTFGNRWVAAYELSKQMASSNIPAEEKPWLAGQLSQIYDQSTDPRTKEFLVVALGTLKDEASLKTLAKALDEEKGNLRFHALVALGNLEKGVSFPWDKVAVHLKSNDPAIVQVAIFTVARHSNGENLDQIEAFLSNESAALRYAAATALIEFKIPVAIPVLKEILLLDSLPQPGAVFNKDKTYALKANVLSALKKAQWSGINNVIEKIAKEDKNVKVVSLARDVLKELKN